MKKKKGIKEKVKRIVDYNLSKRKSVLKGIIELSESMADIGFQATNIGRAIKIIERMKKEKATIFLTFTANMIASGIRGIIKDMVKKKFVDVIITTGGSIDHDLIRSYADYYQGDFLMDDVELHKKGINRIGNILVPNERYVLLEEKMKKILKGIYKEKKVISPSELIQEIGKSIKNKDSFLYWAKKNNIPVYSPGITDSAIGLQLYFFKQSHPDFIVDVTKDMKELASLTINSEKTGGIILGGGISKHHAIGVNLLKGGLDYAVYLTTSQPWDGSLSGARTNEAISWGKIKEEGRHISIDGDVTITLPLVMAKFLV